MPAKQTKKNQSAATKNATDYVEEIIAHSERIPSKAEQARRAQEGRVLASRLKYVKQRAYEFELRNRSKILAFFSGPGWHKIGGVSALIYVHEVAPRIGLTPSLKPDRDFYAKFLDGVVSVHDMESLTKAFESAGIKVVAQDEDMTVFDYGRELSNAEIDAMRAVREQRLVQLGQIVKVSEMFPSITAGERKIAKTLRSKMIRATQADKDMIMTNLARRVLTATVDLVMMGTSEPKKAKEILQQVLSTNERVKHYVMQLMEIGVLEIEETLRIEENILDVNTQIQAELAK